MAELCGSEPCKSLCISSIAVACGESQRLIIALTAGLHDLEICLICLPAERDKRLKKLRPQSAVASPRVLIGISPTYCQVDSNTIDVKLRSLSHGFGPLSHINFNLNVV